jgi:hypothetical protein
MLTFEATAIDLLIQEHRRALESIAVPNGWGCGKIVDNFSGLTGLFFRLLGQQNRTPSRYDRDPGDGVQGATRETFHPTVRIRRSKLPAWKPPALKGFEPAEPPGEGKPWLWTRKGAQTLPEYVMLPTKTMSVAYEERGGMTKYKTIESMSRVLCPEPILNELDEVNNVTNGN